MHLRVSEVSKAFGSVTALKDVSIEFLPGTITTIVGPNGAGKTTLFNVISGYTKPDRGVVLLDVKNITGQPPRVIAANGLGRLFQEARIFKSLSVFDNLLVAAKDIAGENPFSALVQLSKIRRQQRNIAEEARGVAAFLGLTQINGKVSEDLSYGQKKLLAVGQLLMRQSRVLLLDELTAGLDDNATKHILGRLRKLADQGRTVVLIEHRWELIAHMSNVMAVFNAGCLIAAGPPSEVLTHYDKLVDL